MISDLVAYGPVYPALIVLAFAVALIVATVREWRRERASGRRSRLSARRRPFDWGVDA